MEQNQVGMTKETLLGIANRKATIKTELLEIQLELLKGLVEQLDPANDYVFDFKTMVLNRVPKGSLDGKDNIQLGASKDAAEGNSEDIDGEA
jgi:hypothetical protein